MSSYSNKINHKNKLNKKFIKSKRKRSYENEITNLTRKSKEE